MKIPYKKSINLGNKSSVPLEELLSELSFEDKGKIDTFDIYARLNDHRFVAIDKKLIINGISNYKDLGHNLKEVKKQIKGMKYMSIAGISGILLGTSVLWGGVYNQEKNLTDIFGSSSASLGLLSALGIWSAGLISVNKIYKKYMPNYIGEFKAYLGLTSLNNQYNSKKFFEER